MATSISEFQILGLHGYRDYTLTLEDNTLILVGENGAGKTSVLRLFASLLAGNWKTANSYTFDSVAVRINGDRVELSKEAIEAGARLEPGEKQAFYTPPHMRKEFRALFMKAALDEDAEEQFIEFCRRVRAPSRLVREVRAKRRGLSQAKDSAGLKKLSTLIRKSGVRPLYLPTYRRTEADLDDVLEHLWEHYYDDEPYARRSLRRRKEVIERSYRSGGANEVMEFDLSDVEYMIKRNVEELQEFSLGRLSGLTQGYLQDIITNEYASLDEGQVAGLSEKEVEEILGRIPDDTVAGQNKAELRAAITKAREGGSLQERDKVMCYYFLKLKDLYSDLVVQEESIQSFCKICSSYMADKALHYSSEEYTFGLYTERSGETLPLDLAQLSYGERQIVSMFCHLHLAKGDYFVIIDEPELSLALTWQETFLVDIHKARNCAGLLVATHSPFTYQNELQEYAHGIGEFINEK